MATTLAPLHIPGSDSAPEVLFNAQTGVFMISGESRSPEIRGIYSKMEEWMEQYVEQPLPKTEFLVQLTYFNTASSKLLYDVFTTLEQCVVDESSEVKVIWQYEIGDEDMQEAGIAFQEVVNLQFEVQPWQ